MTDKNAKNKSKMPGNSRLCHITKWDNFDGYGFDLHAEKGKPGQYIGKVDAGSPAQAAGLRHGDRILEVNGENITGKTHRDVVELIKAISGETKLLVVDGDEQTSSPSPSPTPTPTPTPVIENNKTNGDVSNGHDKHDGHLDKQQLQQENKEIPQENGALNLNMTAAELRARLAARKKFDPKKESMDFKKKFDIIQKL